MALKTFYCAIKPVLITGKVLGLIPFKFSTNGYVISKWNVIFIITTSILYVIFVSEAIYIRVQVITSNVLTTTTDILQMASASTQVIVIWISSVYLQKDHIKLLNKIQEIDKNIQTLGVWIYHDTHQKSAYIRIILRIIIILTSIMVQAVVYQFGKAPFVLIVNCTFYFPVIINSAICLQVSIYIRIVREYYAILNTYLFDLQENPEKPQEVYGVKSIALFSTTQSVLQMVSLLHHQLSQIVYFINKTFGVGLLAIFGVTFVTIIVDFYYCISALQNPNYASIEKFVATVANCLPYIVDAGFLCYLCNSASEEANLSGTLIHKVESSDEELEKYIQLFSLQLAHEKVEFNAGGFFPINYTLIFLVIGGVTTNLVILLQFSTTSQ